jgi:hypothetical protein
MDRRHTQQTLELPTHRKARLNEILTSVEGRKRCIENDMHKLLGELWCMGRPYCESVGHYDPNLTEVEDKRPIL